MKGTHIFFISLFLMLCVGGYFFYKYWSPAQELEVWDLVPESAILVFESNQSVEDWNEIQEKVIWQNLEQIPYYANVRTKVELLDSLSGGKGKLHQLLQSKPFLFSVHRISKQELDYVFFIPLKGPSDLEIISTLVDRYQNRDDFKFQSRTYQDLVIHEAVNREYEEVFSYLIHRNVFIGSFTPFLVEDVIRNISGQSENSFASVNPRIFEVAKLDNDQGNIYVNINKVPQLISAFIDEQASAEFTNLSSLAQSSFLDFKLDHQRVLLNGFTLTEQQEHPYLENLSGFQGGPLGFESILPNDVAILYHLTFADPLEWHQRLRSYWERHRTKQLDSWDQLEDDLNWDPTELVALQKEEIGIAIMGAVEDETPDRLVYLRVNDRDQGLQTLDMVAQKAAEAAGSPLYTETFGNKQITQIDLPQLPAIVWGGLFHGFDQCFFMPVGEYIVISSSITGLKQLERAVESEETWGKSIVRGEFLNSSLQEANLSYYVNLPRAWNMIRRNLTPEWREFLELHSSTLQNFELMSFQFSDIGDKFYTSGVITYHEPDQQQQMVPMFNNRQQVLTGSPIISKPFVVTNHNNGSKEVLLQDSLRQLYLIGSQGRTLWQDSLIGSIRGNVSQVDFYGNNKLQYLLATEKEIHIIDRNGKSIEGFPISVPTNIMLRNVALIDYDNSKRYRFIASDESGHLFMYNKQGELLDGWNPKVLQDQLVEAPQHIRVRGKDCIIAIQENGLVHIMNRRGNPYPGFPVELSGSVEGPLFIEQGTDFSNTMFTSVTRNGLIVKFDLNGKVIEREQLLRPTTDTYFQLCMDPLKRHFVIKRQNANRLGILNRRGEVMFEKDYLSTANLAVQYYLLANNHSIYAVTDPVQHFTYFYDQDGELINATPIESTHEIAMLYFENQRQHQIYSVYDNRFALLSF